MCRVPEIARRPIFSESFSLERQESTRIVPRDEVEPVGIAVWRVRPGLCEAGQTSQSPQSFVKSYLTSPASGYGAAMDGKDARSTKPGSRRNTRQARSCRANVSNGLLVGGHPYASQFNELAATFLGLRLRGLPDAFTRVGEVLICLMPHDLHPK